MTPRSRRNRPDRSSSDLVKRVSAQGPGRSFGTQRRIRRLIRSIGGAVIALPLALLLLIGVRFASMPITQAAALSAYESGAYDQVGPRLTAVQTANLFETYLPHLTEGTAKLQAGDAAGAEKDLRRALDEWEKGKDINSPPYSECIIRNNLAIAIVEGAPAETGDARGAKMNEAQEVLQPCLPGGASEDNNENQEQTSGTGEAIEQEKQKNSGQDPGDEENPGGGQDPGDEENPGGDGTDDPQEPGGEESPTTGPEPGSEQERKERELEERNNPSADPGSPPNNDGVKPW